MDKWIKTKLRNILTIKHGFPFQGEYFSTTGKYILLTPGNFYEEGGFKRDTKKDKYYLGDFPSSYIHKKGDLIVAMTEQAEGLLGSCAIVPESNLYLHNQRLGLVQVNEEKADKIFIYYLFQLKYIRQQIRLTSSGTKVKHTSPERIYEVEALLPPLSVQKQISSILSSLDKKIELNNKINQKLKAMAKMIYDYWFVQFDFPDANGKPYKSSGGNMVYNKELKREIPEGWDVDSLWNIADYYNGLAMQKHRPTDHNNRLPVIKIKEMNEGFSDKTEWAKSDIPNETIVENGDVLFSWSATLKVMLWTQGRGALNQHIFKVTSSKYPKTFYYFELKNYLHHFIMMAEKRKTTMGHITQDHLKDSYIVIPPKNLIESMDKKLSPLLEKQILLEEENYKLSQLRDWLLPMLMNGQVKVSDAVKIVTDLLMAAEPKVEYGASKSQ